MTTDTATEPVAAYLESTLGLSFTGPRRTRLLAAIERDRRAAGLSQEEFLAAVSRPGSAFDRLVAEVTVGETYFFRDRAQCDLLGSIVLPALVEQGAPQRGVALWSAGCASGEEAYTLAALAEAAGLGDRCTVVGSDASRRAIAKAERATYGRWSMRATAPHELEEYFAEQDDRFHVSERLRRRTRFVQRNLLDGPPPPGRFDVVLCRNLLIYLTRDAVQQAAQVLAGALTPTGWLITAAGDPPLEGAGLESVQTRYGYAYRPARAAAPPERTRAQQPPAPPRAAVRGRPPARSAVAPPSSHRLPTAAVAAAPPGASADQLAEQVRLLGNSGRLAEACRTAAAAVAAHPLDVQLRYLAGVVLLEAGRLDEAEAAASQAVYLGPDLAAAHLLLGQVEHARGNTARARRSFRNGSRLLAAHAEGAPVALAGDVPAAHLAAVAARYLTPGRSS